MATKLEGGGELGLSGLATSGGTFFLRLPLVTCLRDQKEIKRSDFNKNTLRGLFNILLIFHIF